MASITIRQLDEQWRRRLRLRAARNGRSMEEEAGTILRHAASLDEGTEPGDTPKTRAPHSTRRRSSATADAPAPAVEHGDPARTKRILLIIGGGIAAYKALDLIRRLKERSLAVRCILTKAAQEFITPLSAAALSGERAFTHLFDPESEFDIGHIRLAREADLIVLAPATADLMAKLAGAHDDHPPCAVLPAAVPPLLLAPPLNPRLWEHRATRLTFVHPAR